MREFRLSSATTGRVGEWERDYYSIQPEGMAQIQEG